MTIDDIVSRIVSLQEELETAYSRRREAFSYELRNRRAVFDARAKALHKSLRMRIPPYIRRARLSIVLSFPFIAVLIVPIALLDILVIIYQAICFPVYGLKKVPRADFIALDRAQLGYLNAIEKFNCLYCSYANGVLSWTREIAGRTESYWCPIKHARRVEGTHAHYPQFLDYGDAEAWRRAMDTGEVSRSA